jgi:hypothetical protein
MSKFADAIAAAAAATPMGNGSVPIVLGRTLFIDGDGLAYYCAGRDGTTAGEAREMLRNKIASARRASSAENVVVLLTASGSNKGHRYAIARAKPYQGQRVNSRRPANWQVLRDYMTSTDFPYPVVSTSVAEADDLFALNAYQNPSGTVIYTQDKDMRMLPGWHLNWSDHRMYYSGVVGGSVIDSVFDGKQYGIKWFWLQMLQGDQADNIPGLPKYRPAPGDAPKLIGEATAAKELINHTNSTYPYHVASLYRSYYEDRWLVEMLEQAALLWLRRKPEAWDDCALAGGPMYPLMEVYADSEERLKAYEEIQGRVDAANELNACAAQVNADSQGTAGTS